MATVRASKLAEGMLDINLTGVDVLPNGAHRASVEQWQYAALFDTHRLIGDLVKEQRATRKVLERMDRRLAKKVKL